MARWIHWHRRIAYVVTGFLIIWIISGWIHPIFSRMGPTLKPVSGWLENTDPIHQARLALGSIDIAESPATVTQLTHFNDEYQAFQKVLPVWRVLFEDEKQTRVIIDIKTGRVISGTDENKLLATRIFKLLHTWDINAFNSGANATLNQNSNTNPTIRDTALVGKTVLASGIVTMTLVGVWLLLLRRKLDMPQGKNAPRMWHRRLGATLAIPLLCFSLSGLLHMHRHNLPEQAKPIEKWTFNVLHKWRFADGLGRDARDVTQCLTTAAIFGLILLGYVGKKR